MGSAIRRCIRVEVSNKKMPKKPTFDSNTADSFRIDAAIVGVHKCATTSLWKALSQHSKITTHHTGQLIPPYVSSLENHDYQNIDCFKNFLDTDADAKFNLIRDTTLYDDFESLERLYNLNPEIKLIVCVRSPADRSFSAFVHAKNRGFEQDYKSIEAAIGDYNARKLELRTPPLLNYFDQSFYYKKIKAISQVVKKENIHVVSTEKLEQDFNESCNKVFDFLDLPTMLVEEIEANKRSELRSKFLNRILSTDSVFKVVARNLLSPRLRTKVLHRIHSLNLSKSDKDQLNDETRDNLDELFLSDWASFCQFANNELSSDIHVS